MKYEFRGMSIYPDNNYVYGALSESPHPADVARISWLDKEGYYCEEKVMPHSIGIFTGLLDRNKKKIYEGDIIDDGKTYRVVLFRDGRFIAKSYYGNPRIPFVKPLKRILWHSWVVGDIHSNPDLLKEKRL